MEIFELVDQYSELLEEKTSAEEALKSIKADIEKIKENLINNMVEAECTSISRNGFKYTLKAKNIYTKRSNEYLYENGIDFFEVLRSEGLGDLIQERVDSRSLSSAINNYIEENGELSEELESCIQLYETFDISKTKETNKVTKGGK